MAFEPARNKKIHVCGFETTEYFPRCKKCSAGDYPANWKEVPPTIEERIEAIEDFLIDLS